MATLAYDLNTFALKDATSGIVIFNHVATREIDLTGVAYGWVETAPSVDVTADQLTSTDRPYPVPALPYLQVVLLR